MMPASSGLRFLIHDMRNSFTTNNYLISYAWGEVKGYLDGTEGHVGGRSDYNLETFRTKKKKHLAFIECVEIPSRGIDVCELCEAAKATIWWCCFATSLC